MNYDLIKNGFFIGNIKDFFSENEIIDIQKKTTLAKNFYENNKNDIFCRYMFNSTENYNHNIKISEIDSRSNYIKNNKFEVTQKWFWFNSNELINYFNDIVYKIYFNFYENDIDETTNNQSQFTVFEKGDFIESHKDGYTQDRICVIILYLNQISTNENDGGQLVIQTNNKSYEIEPIFGNFAILDFTQNNIIHSVNPVNGNFKRMSFIRFFDKK